jgi:hypothetical protein
MMGLTDIERRSLSVAASNLNDLPVRVPRDRAAELVTQIYFEISPRTLERWPLVWRRLNGKAHCETRDLFAVAESMLGAAPAIAAGSRLAAT